MIAPLRSMIAASLWGREYYLAYQFGGCRKCSRRAISALAAIGEVEDAPFRRVNTPIVGLKISYFQPKIGYRFGWHLLITFSHDSLWRVENNDAYCNCADGIPIRAGESGCRWLGQWTQIFAHYEPVAQLIINTYWPHLYAGDVIEEAEGDDHDCFYIGFNVLL